MFFSQFGVISRARISGSLALCLLVSSRHEESQTQRLNGPEKHTLAMLCYATAFLSFSLAVLCVFLVERRKGVWSRRRRCRLSLAFFACV